LADLASLKISVDSTDVRKADADLAEMSNSAGRTSASMDRMIAANNRMSAALQTSNKATIDAVKYINSLSYELETVGKSALQLRAIEIRMAAARAPTAELQQEIRSLGAQLLIAERNADRASGGAATGITGMGNSSKLASHHSMNLFHQLNDVFVSLSSGQKPMTVFIQQGSQIGGIMAQAGIGVGGLARALLGMASAAAMAVLTNPVLLAAAAAAAAAFIAFKSFQSSVEDSGALKEYAKSLGLTSKEMKDLGPIGITAMDVIKGVWNTISDGLGLQRVFSAIGTFFSQLFSGIAETAFELTAGLYGVFVGTYRGIIRVWDMLPAAFGDLVISAVNATIRGLEGMINLAIGAINKLVTQANKILSLLQMPTLSLVPTIDIPEIQNKYAGAANKAGTAFVGEIKKSISEAKTAMVATGGAFADGVMNASMDRLAGKADGIIDDRTEKALKDKAGKTGKEAGEKLAEEFAKTVLAMQAEINVTWSKEDEDRMKAIVQADMKELEQTMIEMARFSELQQAERARVLQQNLKTAQDGAQMIGDVIGGSIGDGIKQLSDVLTKNFPDFMSEIGKSLEGIKGTFNDLLGGLGTSLKELGAFAGVGGAAARATGGSALGGSIGGALGGVVGKSFAALGKFGGPLGAIAGGILGGVIGGLLKKTKSSSATISAVAGRLDVGAIVGSNSQFRQAANTLAGAVVNGLSEAANLLGAEITNAINISIGQRGDKFVVDTLGRGRTRGSGTTSFETEAEAISYAIDQAIRTGVLGGLRAGTQRLLQGFGDLEERLADAVNFENVFKAMEASVDPVTFALGQLDTKFAGLIETFRRAGATAEEFATLEAYYQRERLRTIEEANQAAIEKANTARDALIEAYERESDAIISTIERFKDLASSLQDFRTSLAEQLMTPEQIYRSARARFEQVSALAATGDEQAISQLIGVSQRYLDTAKTFLTPEEYNREIANVMRAVDLAIVQTKTLEEYAQGQLDALNASVDGLITLNESTLSVVDAIKALETAIAERDRTIAETTLRFDAAALTEAVDEAIRDAFEQYGGDYFNVRGFASGGDFGGGLRIVGENGPELEATGASRIYNAAQTAEILSGGGNVATQIANMRSEMQAGLFAIAKNTGKTSDQLNRWDGDGLPDTRDWAA
jgi:hypothetical protein